MLDFKEDKVSLRKSCCIVVASCISLRLCLRVWWGGEGFRGRKVEGKIEESCTFFLEYFIENDK
jgi:hypothetical protein